MGTNYYVRKKISEQEKQELKALIDQESFGELQNRIPEKVHIGKSSGGWKFIFNHNNWEHYKNIDELQAFIEENEFFDEYGRKVDPDEFWENVEHKQRDPDMLDGKSYKERWDEIHPGYEKPAYMLRGETGDEYHEGYRFSTSIHFS